MRDLADVLRPVTMLALMAIGGPLQLMQPEDQGKGKRKQQEELTLTGVTVLVGARGGR